MQRIALLALVLFVLTLRAERPPQQRSQADVVVSATVEKVEAAQSKFGPDGIRTDYTATVKLTSVEKGDVKVGSTVKLTWFYVTKRPSGFFAGAFGQDHGLKANDQAKFWLLGEKQPYTIIYNSEGVEKLKK
ncbi:MAG: hypothetical protein EBV06_10905 [Planctomycetia bacterium]|nr:hypothetical protein [Planctomycetia bacterium]